jgi:hypothetical protein
VAAYGEAKRQRFLSELAQLEENIHLARSQARDKLDRYSLQQMVGALCSLRCMGGVRFALSPTVC